MRRYFLIHGTGLLLEVPVWMDLLMEMTELCIRHFPGITGDGTVDPEVRDAEIIRILVWRCVSLPAFGTPVDLVTARASAVRTYEAAVELFAMLCKKFGLDPLADGVVISHREGPARGITTNHGDPEHLWKGLGLAYTMDGFRKAVKAAMSGKAEGTQASVFPGLSDGKAAERIGVLCAEDMKTSGILASVSAAQFILESGYGRTELAQKANNCFGMKCVLSGNSWGGSA